MTGMKERRKNGSGLRKEKRDDGKIEKKTR